MEKGLDGALDKCFQNPNQVALIQFSDASTVKNKENKNMLFHNVLDCANNPNSSILADVYMPESYSTLVWLWVTT